MATKKFILAEKDIPQAWYNVIADMPGCDVGSTLFFTIVGLWYGRI